MFGRVDENGAEKNRRRMSRLSDRGVSIMVTEVDSAGEDVVVEATEVAEDMQQTARQAEGVEDIEVVAATPNRQCSNYDILLTLLLTFTKSGFPCAVSKATCDGFTISELGENQKAASFWFP
jgi:hypothetical protein